VTLASPDPNEKQIGKWLEESRKPGPALVAGLPKPTALYKEQERLLRIAMT
jgi:hypothetical protein